MITAPSRFGGFLRRREGRSTAHREQHRHRGHGDLAHPGAPATRFSEHRRADPLHAVAAGAVSRENDFGALKQTLVAWCECGFNLVTTAQRLAIHRLDKISRLTARDVREPQVAIAAYLACLIDE